MPTNETKPDQQTYLQQYLRELETCLDECANEMNGNPARFLWYGRRAVEAVLYIQWIQTGREWWDLEKRVKGNARTGRDETTPAQVVFGSDPEHVAIVAKINVLMDASSRGVHVNAAFVKGELDKLVKAVRPELVALVIDRFGAWNISLEGESRLGVAVRDLELTSGSQRLSPVRAMQLQCESLELEIASLRQELVETSRRFEELEMRAPRGAVDHDVPRMLWTERDLRGSMPNIESALRQRQQSNSLETQSEQRLLQTVVESDSANPSSAGSSERGEGQPSPAVRSSVGTNRRGWLLTGLAAIAGVLAGGLATSALIVVGGQRSSTVSAGLEAEAVVPSVAEGPPDLPPDQTDAGLDVAMEEPAAALPVAMDRAEANSPDEPGEIECPEGMVAVASRELRLGQPHPRPWPAARPAEVAAFTVPQFCIHRREISEGEFEAWLADTERTLAGPGCRGQRADFPAACVTDELAAAYCIEHGWALPSIAQWESVARESEGVLTVSPDKVEWAHDLYPPRVFNRRRGCTDGFSAGCDRHMVRREGLTMERSPNLRYSWSMAPMTVPSGQATSDFSFRCALSSEASVGPGLVGGE